jgi:hypothetical protein
MTKSMLPDSAPPRIRHSWRCTRAGGLLDEERELPDGRVLTVTVCASCGGSDIEHRLRVEREGSS